jgi:hypothetical protein
MRIGARFRRCNTCVGFDQEVFMVRIDHNLIHQARRLINGANIHQMNIYLLLYEKAVTLHNDGHPKHVDYHDHYERLLRQFVQAALPAQSLSESLNLSRRRAHDLSQRTQELQRDLDEQIRKAQSIRL